MTAYSLIAYDIPALHLGQTGKEALHLLNEHHIKHLPVVDDKRLVGLLSEEDIYNHDLQEPINEYDLLLLRRFAVRSGDHVFEVIRIMGDNLLTVIPVIDDTGNYLGLIAQNDLLRYFAQLAAFGEAGGVLVLEMNRRDYSLSTLAHIVEDEDAKILSLFVTSLPDAETIELTMKINRQELSRIVASMERYDYLVKESFADVDHTDSLQERYDSLMNYLNI